jgi:hypothetical protein
MRKRWDVPLEDRNAQRRKARHVEKNMDVRYEVSAVTTYKVTRMESSDNIGSILTVGEYGTEEMAKRAADLFQQAAHDGNIEFITVGGGMWQGFPDTSDLPKSEPQSDMSPLADVPRGATAGDFVAVAMRQLPENLTREDIERAMHHVAMAWGGRVRSASDMRAGMRVKLHNAIDRICDETD